MSAWQYRVTANGQSTGVQCNWNHLTAVAACKENRGGWPADIERRRENARMNGAWLAHRCYVVGADGEVMRTDHTKPHEGAR